MNNFDTHILVVDDDEEIRELVKEYLKKNKYLVTTAKDSEDAQNKVRTIPGVLDVNVELVWEPQWDRDMMTEEAKLQLGML